MLVNADHAYAADISALDFNGDLLGKVIPDGSVINFDNELIGHITADGLVLNNENELVGGIVPQGTVISVDNTILGKVNNDGSVTSVNDNLIGKVLPNGLVVNNNYDVVGNVVAPGLVYNDNGIIVGRVSGDGKFYNLSGENNGFVTTAGYVYAVTETERKLNLIGKLISSKMIISSNGKFLGSIAPDGKVIDLKKNNIGSIHANGFVYSADDVAIGHVVETGYAFNFDGTYLGVVSYNGEVVANGAVVAQAIFGNRVINKDGGQIGFTINMAATFNTLDGKYLGRLISNGMVVKGRNVVGKIGASGNVINTKGEVIGFMNQSGPIYDYLGQLKANAATNGEVFSLEGTKQGYMQKARAIDYKEKEIGKLLENRLNFDNRNTFIGLSGIDTIFKYKEKKYATTPYGYIFDEQGNLEGKNYKFSGIYSPDGSLLTSISCNGRVDNLSLNERGKLTSAGYFVDKNDRLMGKIIDAQYATNFAGESLGYINSTNLIVDGNNNLYAKILPNDDVIAMDNKAWQNYGRVGNASLSIGINGDYLGLNTAKGEVENAGEIIGKVSSNQYVLDNFGALYGKAQPFGVVANSECKFLGVVSDTGEARTSDGKYLGMILANGQVINDSQEFIGQVIVPKGVNGKNGDIIGTENALGMVLNYKNQSLGCQDIYGKVRNNQKEVIGQIIPNVSVMNFKNQIIGHTNSSGKVIATTGESIGFVDIDNGVYNESGEDIGVLFKYTVAFDNNNIYLGRVNPDAQVISDNGEVIGSVDYNGVVKTSDGGEGFALYDLYVYDNEGKTVGYIAKNGRVYNIMGDLKGVIYNGFVLDKKQNLVARGARDYDIRNKNNKVVGYLMLDGRVISIRNIEVGSLADEGHILDSNGKEIALAHRLQYYLKQAEPVNEEIIIENNEQEDGSQTSKNRRGSSLLEGDEQYEDENTDMEENEYEDEDESEEVSSNRKKKRFNGEDEEISSGKRADRKGKNFNEDIDEFVDSVSDEDDEFSDNDEDTLPQEGASKKTSNKDWVNNIIKNVVTSPYQSDNTASNVGPGGGIGPGGRYNPRRAAILSKLYETRRSRLAGKVISNNTKAEAYTGWEESWESMGVGRSISSLRVDMSNMLTGDKPIPAVLARSLISIGSTPITAIVERNVYGDSGRNVIIPAGSRIIGGLQTAAAGMSRVDNSSGGVKLPISWTRIIRPDGISFNLASSETGDAEGRGGGAVGYVDEQLVKKYAVPLLGTLATSAMAYLTAANADAVEGQQVETSKQQAANDARQNFLDKMNEILDQIIANKEQIETITYVPAGTRIIIYPMADLWLRTTKDVIEGKGSTAAMDNVGERPLINENSGGGDSQSAQVQGNNKGNQPTSAPLIAEGNGNNQNNANVNMGALPPSSADGTGMPIPEEPEDEDEVDLKDFDF